MSSSVTRRRSHHGAVPVAPHAEPYHGGQGQVGVLFCHGFTGSPHSMLPWAKATEAAGFRVSLPRLPGHGTSWREMNATGWPDWYACVERELAVLVAECDTVFVAGLSMGGGLALLLAEDHGDDIAGLALVNPSVGSADKTMRFVPLLRRLRSSVAAISSDIARPDTREGAYDRTPLQAVASLMQLWRRVGGRLGSVRTPIVLFRSRVDHIVDPSSAALILDMVSSTEVTEGVLERSHHVATLDYDAELIFTESIEFFRRLSADRTGSGADAALTEEAGAGVGPRG